MKYKKIFVNNCHTGNVFINKFNDCRIFGGGYTNSCSPPSDGIVLDLADCFDSRNIITNSTILLPPALIETATCNYDTINLNWVDGEILEVSRDFWIELSKYLLTLKKDVLVCCFGGHGRTGTALSILYHFMEIFSTHITVKHKYTNIVLLIRSIYCKHAVETIQQLYYIENICNIKLPQKLKENLYIYRLYPSLLEGANYDDIENS
jgi:hypothetical protein